MVSSDEVPPTGTRAAAAGTLAARTAPLPENTDILDVVGEQGLIWARPGLTLAGIGCAFTIDVPRTDPSTAARAVSDALGVIDHEAAGNCSPIAIGALPFDADRPGQLTVPALLMGRGDSGSGWVTAVSPGGTIDPIEALSVAASRPRLPIPRTPTRFDIHPMRPVDDWCEAVVTARDALRSGRANKVVLARSIEIHTDTAVSRQVLVERLRTTFPTCMIYAVDGLIGASPELLVARTGDKVRSHPMAGTAPRSDDPELDARIAAELTSSHKDLTEHRYTIDMVHETLLPWCSWLDEEAEPSLVTMANVRHLATLVEGRLSSPPASVIELMTALHPTPAVCGSPGPSALELIRELEDLDRGCYSGPVGWVDANGDGEWAVAIRCAQLNGLTARLMAGVGIVADSDVESELAETRAKLQALLGAIVRP